MKGRTHLLAGTAAGSVAAAVTYNATGSWKIATGVLGFTMIGSLFPDIDNTQSMLGRKIKPISFIINKIWGHRGFIHTPFNMLCLSAIALFAIYFYSSQWCIPFLIGFMVGMGSHLLLDAITKGGIAFLYPFSQKKFNFTKMKTGGKAESVISVLMLLAAGGATTALLMIK